MARMKADLGGSAGAVVAGGALVVVLALGAYIGLGGTTSDAPDAPVAASAPAPDAPEPVQTVQSAPEAPTLDELRRESDGTTIIAGRAAPLSAVRIMLDGVQVGDATADSSGGFAAIAMLPPKQTAQVLTLQSTGSDIETAAAEEIILAPAPAPVAGPDAPTPTPPAEAAVQIAGQLPAQTPAQIPAQTLAQPAGTAPSAPEPARMAVLKSDAQGVRLLNPQLPEAMTSIALDTIGYSEQGDVQLTGRAQPDTQKVRVYLDNRAIITLPVGADGRWNGDLPDVDEGIYTLRVDELTAAGDVSSRVETPFKRESGAVLAQAAATSEGAVKSVTVQTGATLWAIARARYGDGTLYVRVFEANAGSIRDPDLIYPGQIFDLPD
jgi:nucleoid-associated protein YgaU